MEQYSDTWLRAFIAKKHLFSVLRADVVVKQNKSFHSSEKDIQQRKKQYNNYYSYNIQSYVFIYQLTLKQHGLELHKALIHSFAK